MDLIERLRSVKWEVSDDAERMPSDPAHECVFVDMRPADFSALLREAAAAITALQIIRTWAAFERDHPGTDVLVPEHVLKICDEALGIDQARGKEGE